MGYNPWGHKELDTTEYTRIVSDEKRVKGISNRWGTPGFWIESP